MVDDGEPSPGVLPAALAQDALRLVAQSATDFISVTTADGRYAFVTAGCRHVLGYEPEDMIGWRVSDLMHPDDLDSTRTARPLVDVDGGRDLLEFRMHHRDGHWVWVESSAQPPGAATGEIVVVTRDVSRRKRAELRLTAAEDRFHKLFDLAHEGVAVHCHGRVIEANPSLAHIFGTTVDALVGAEFASFAGQAFHDLLVERERLDVKDSVVATATRLTGLLITVEVSGEPILLDGEWCRTVALRDITEQVAAEEVATRYAAQLEAVNADLLRSNRELEQFAYVASHDLKEPLRAIGSYNQLLARRYQGHLDEQADEWIAFTVAGIARMRALVDDLLTYARVGNETRTEPISLDDALRTATTNLTASIDEAGAQIIVLSPLPAVLGDNAQIVQLLQNLLGNAIKFSDKTTPRIEVSGDLAGPMVEVRVVDHGVGIDPTDAERIFKMFERLHGRAEYPGTGIGLAICQKIVERHGGRIWVTPTRGSGSTFHFTLPAVDP